MSLTVDVHVLQSLPPSCINRDDLGAPKTATYGGVQRLRVSSQSWKRAARMQSLQDEVSERAVRTREVYSTLAQRIGEVEGVDGDDLLEFVKEAMAGTGIEPDKKAPTRSSIILFASGAQLDKMADVLRSHAADYAGMSKTAKKKFVHKDSDLVAELDATLKGAQGRDIALYGRMVASRPGWGVEAGMRVAHAISTHATTIGADYFTAVDDLVNDDSDDAGAAMIGDIEYSSGTLYRYASVNIDQLTRNCGGDAAQAREFLVDGVSAFVKSMPTGRQATMAAHTLPDMVLITVRDGQGVSLAGAFEEPVSTLGDGSLMSRSTTRLGEALGDLSLWGGTDLFRGAMYTRRTQANSDSFGDAMPFDTLIGEVANAVKQGQQ